MIMDAVAAWNCEKHGFLKPVTNYNFRTHTHTWNCPICKKEMVLRNLPNGHRPTA